MAGSQHIPVLTAKHIVHKLSVLVQSPAQFLLSPTLLLGTLFGLVCPHTIGSKFQSVMKEIPQSYIHTLIDERKHLRCHLQWHRSLSHRSGNFISVLQLLLHLYHRIAHVIKHVLHICCSIVVGRSELHQMGSSLLKILRIGEARQLMILHRIYKDILHKVGHGLLGAKLSHILYHINLSQCSGMETAKAQLQFLGTRSSCIKRLPERRRLIGLEYYPESVSGTSLTIDHLFVVSDRILNLHLLRRYIIYPYRTHTRNLKVLILLQVERSRRRKQRISRNHLSFLIPLYHVQSAQLLQHRLVYPSLDVASTVVSHHLRDVGSLRHKSYADTLHQGTDSSRLLVRAFRALSVLHIHRISLLVRLFLIPDMVYIVSIIASARFQSMIIHQPVVCIVIPVTDGING